MSKNSRDLSDRFDDIEIEPLEDEDAPIITKPEVAENTNAMLAEVSFMEVEDLLARGDRAGAISHCRSAISYDPGKVEYYAKLADLLGDNSNTRAEACRHLEKAIELAPNNIELRIKLKELRDGKIKREPATTPKKGTTRTLRESATSALDETELIKKDVKELEKSTPEQIKEAKRRSDDPVYDLATGSAENRDTRRLTSRLKDPRHIRSQSPALPNKISAARWLLIALAFLVVFGGIGYRLLPSTQIHLTTPDNASFDAKDLNFQWDCKRADLFFVVEVFSEGELIMKQMVKGRSYAPDYNQLKYFHANQSYNWRITTAIKENHGVELESELRSFQINREVASTPPPPPPSTENETPAPIAKPQSPPPPVRPRHIITDDVKG